VLGLLALFTHIHLFWVAGLLLALIDIPDFSGSFTRMAGALETIAAKPAEGAAAAKDAIPAIMSDGEPVEAPTVMVGTKPDNGVAELPSRPKLAPVTGRS
jgi:hypothetical protein